MGREGAELPIFFVAKSASLLIVGDEVTDAVHLCKIFFFLDTCLFFKRNAPHTLRHCVCNPLLLHWLKGTSCFHPGLALYVCQSEVPASITSLYRWLSTIYVGYLSPLSDMRAHEVHLCNQVFCFPLHPSHFTLHLAPFPFYRVLSLRSIVATCFSVSKASKAAVCVFFGRFLSQKSPSWCTLHFCLW